jgi:hypothetical protein
MDRIMDSDRCVVAAMVSPSRESNRLLGTLCFAQPTSYQLKKSQGLASKFCIGRLFFQKRHGELIFGAMPFFIAAVAFCGFFTAFFANVSGNVLLLLFTVAETGSAFDGWLFF